MNIETLAEAIFSRGLAAPAVLLLEATKPLSGLLSPALLLSEPILGAFIGFQRYRQHHDFWSKNENVEALVQKLEELMSHDRN